MSSRGASSLREDRACGPTDLSRCASQPEALVPERRYVLKHRWAWEQANGPVPQGHALKCLDGNRQNCEPSNWEAVPRALLPRLAGKVGRYKRTLAYDDAEPEVRPSLLAIAKLAHRRRTLASADTRSAAT